MGGGMSPGAGAAAEASSLEDANYKSARISTEERREKIHRYIKKRNERNFSKKIKVTPRTRTAFLWIQIQVEPCMLLTAFVFLLPAPPNNGSTLAGRPWRTAGPACAADSPRTTTTASRRGRCRATTNMIRL
jgi:hypothetical protein